MTIRASSAPPGMRFPDKGIPISPGKSFSPGKTFTLIELLVVIAIIGILCAMLLPALKRARDIAKTGVCINNQKQIILATTNYLGDYDEFFPYRSALHEGNASRTYIKQDPAGFVGFGLYLPNSYISGGSFVCPGYSFSPNSGSWADDLMYNTFTATRLYTPYTGYWAVNTSDTSSNDPAHAGGTKLSKFLSSMNYYDRWGLAGTVNTWVKGRRGAFVADTLPNFWAVEFPWAIPAFHNGSINIGHIDGHVETQANWKNINYLYYNPYNDRGYMGFWAYYNLK